MNEMKSLFGRLILFLMVFAGVDIAQAQFNYNAGYAQYGDVLVCFRPTSTGSYDLVVDAGSITTFTALTTGQKITINPTYYNGSQLAYIGTNGISWAVFACERLPGPKSTNNIWVTRARASLNTQSV